MTAEGRWELVLTPPARQALSRGQPEALAIAAIAVMTSASAQEPRRVGKPSRGEFAVIWWARRGTYRLLYRLMEPQREVVVLRIEHRRDVYRT